jgi:hypothetical protein
MSARSEGAAGASAARALRASLTAVLASASTFFACATEPDTIRLLEMSDAGAAPSGCQSDADCSADKPRCETSAHRCVECLLATECAQGMSCSSTSHTCESSCASNADCDGLDQKVCNSNGACVQCASDEDCAGTQKPRCDTQGGVCVQCLTQTDCNPRTCFDDCLTCLNNSCVWKT